MKEKNYFYDLPNDIILHILSFFPRLRKRKRIDYRE